jgi:hypothetical protein
MTRATLSAMGQPNQKAEHVFAVLRLDPPHDGNWSAVRGDAGTYITVKELVPTQAEAEREVKRLAALSEELDCIYFAQVTRLTQMDAT